MARVIAVLNAGSSSIKFSLFRESPGSENSLQLSYKGQVEGLYNAPHFIARDRSGTIVSEKSWGEGAPLGHEGGLDHLRGFLREVLAGDGLDGVGHRVVHGGAEYATPVRVDNAVLDRLEHLVPLAESSATRAGSWITRLLS